MPLASPLVAAVHGGRLHLVGRTGHAERCAHAAIDADGGVERLPDLRLASPVALAGGAEGLVVLGGDAGGAAIVLVLGDDGAERSRGRLPLGADLAVWPAAAGDGDAVWLAWATGERPSALRSCRLGEHAEPLELGDAAGPTRDVAIALTDRGPVAAWSHEGRETLELVAWGAGDVRRQPVGDAGAPVSPALAAAGDRLALAWIARGEAAPRLAWFDAPCSPPATSSELPAAADPARPRSVRLAGAPDGRLAILLQTAAPRPGVATGPGNRPSAVTVRAELIVVDSDGARSSWELDDPGTAQEACAWLGDRVVVVHGEGAPVVTVVDPR